MKRTPDQDHLPPSPAPAADVEIWDPDATAQTAPTHPRTFRTRTRLTASVPGAVAGAFLVCALAFGATLQATGGSAPGAGGERAAMNETEQGQPDYGQPDSGQPEDDVIPDWEKPDYNDRPDGEHETEPMPDPKPEPKPDPKPKPKPEPKPDPKPEPKPDPKPAVLGLTVAVKDGGVYIDFSECKVDGAEVYKVVRSTDETVKWPAGDNDTLIAAIGMGDKTAAWDKHAPAGKKAWYRVFCVRHTDAGYKVLNSSAVRGIKAPAADPAPEPKHMGIEVAVDGAHVVIAWDGCGSEQFSHYRILRRTGDSTVVVKEIEDAGTTTWVDESVEAGVTYKYMVQAKGKVDGSYVLLGSTDWAAVTVD